MGIFHRLNDRLMGGLRLALILAVPVFAATDVAALSSGECQDGMVDVRGDFGQVRFRVELALTPAEQAKGLMNRESLPRLSGMLFVYPRESDVAFWMRNTLIPLDMIFADDEGRIVRVHENAVHLFWVQGVGSSNLLAPTMRYIWYREWQHKPHSRYPGYLSRRGDGDQSS